MDKFHPSPVRFWLYGGLSILLVLFAFWAFSSVVQVFGVDAVLLQTAAILLISIYVAFMTASYRLTSYYTTSDSLVMERALLSSERMFIPMKNIDNVRVKVSVVGQLLAVVDIFVDTPGGVGVELVMHDIQKFAADSLLDEIEKAKKE